MASYLTTINQPHDCFKVEKRQEAFGVLHHWPMRLHRHVSLEDEFDRCGVKPADRFSFRHGKLPQVLLLRLHGWLLTVVSLLFTTTLTRQRLA